MIGIIDYGSGNINAIVNVHEQLNVSYTVVKQKSDLLKSKKLILPGVGSFDQTMDQLNKSGLRDYIDNLVIEKKVPVLGICVGMQIMACSSEEGTLPGLGWFKNSTVKKIDVLKLTQKPSIPHMGWNNVSPVQKHSILKEIDFEHGFYFLHSYVFNCRSENILLTTNYGSEFPSAINTENIFGFQFHPEKSHLNGLNLFKNFANLVTK